jgi:hypothetical protein
LKNERLDVFYQDLQPGELFDSVKGWKIADADIPVNGKKVFEWSDKEAEDRKQVGKVFVRYYLIGRADIATGGDGVPDARRIFVSEKDPLFMKGVKDPKKDRVLTSDNVLENDQGSGNGSQGVKKSRIIYVDCNIGDDTYTGLSDGVTGMSGPKRTVNAGIHTAIDGDTVVVQGGVYNENVNVCGRSIILTARGTVIYR